MTKRERAVLLFFSVFLFALIAPLIIFYSQGYRFDIETKKFFQTGAFSFKVLPRGALIFINGKQVEKTDFLFGTAYIDNLLPKRYDIEIKKEGYLSWKKTLEIRTKWVTESKNIFLVQENPQFNILATNIENFFLSPSKKLGVLKKNTGEEWELNILDLERNISSPLFQGNQGTEFRGLEWSSDSKKILIKTKVKENEHLVVEIDEKLNLYHLDFLRNDIVDVFFSPRNSQNILFSQDLSGRNNLFTANYKSEEISGLILNNFITFGIFNNDFFWLDSKGFFRQSDFSGNEIRQFNKEAFILNPGSQYQLFIFAEDKIFLKENGSLYFLNQDSQSFDNTSERIKDVKISPDLKKIVYFTDYEIWILFLEKIEDQPRKEKGEKLFLARFSEKIEDIFWYSAHYLIFSVGDKVKIIEIDDRNGINAYNLADFENPPKEGKLPAGQSEIFWNNFDKKLYILRQGNLSSSEKLLP